MVSAASFVGRRDPRFSTDSNISLLEEYSNGQWSKQDDQDISHSTRSAARWDRLASRARSRKCTYTTATLLLVAAIATYSVYFRPMHTRIVMTEADYVKPWVYPPVHWEPSPTPRKALILGSYKKQNVTWMKNVPLDWEIYRYLNDDSSAQYHTPTRAGNEASAYLTFIIDFYDNLPDYMVFLHGHDRGWHQPEHTVQKIRALNLTALRDSGYLSLRCERNPGCTPGTVIHIKDPHANPNDHRWMLEVLPGFLEWMFPELKEPPEVISSPCCAQFAATKGQVLRRSKAWWQKYRRPLIQGVRKWSIDVWDAPDDGIGAYKAGVAYEKTYHLAFGKPPVYCPDQDECRKVFYSDAIHCDRYTGTFRQSKDWENITCTSVFDAEGV